ncbi:hypothetical protein [Niveibacterium terrae]|uniref:hypothetical protein n=1 Tax=Niveibacterium terrae TaxID=3373598 RepID=UPI003A9573CE
MDIRPLSASQRALIAAEESTRIIVMSDNGHTRLMLNPAVLLAPDGRLLLLELQSQLASDRKLIHTLGLQQRLTLGFGGQGGEFLNIVAQTAERHFLGRLFQEVHERLHAECGKADLVGVWVLDVLEAEYEDSDLALLAGGLTHQRAFASPRASLG